MESWFDRIVVELEDLLCGRCDFLDELIANGILTFNVLYYDKSPRISFTLVEAIQREGSDTTTLTEFEIEYNQVEEYFYFELVGEGDGNSVRVMLEDTDSLLDFVHNRVHNIMDMEEYNGVITSDGQVYKNEEELLEHFNLFAKEKEENDSNLKDVEWFSNIESIAKMDVPKKKEMKSIIEFGVNEFKKEFAIKKSLLVRGESNEYIAGEAQLSYLIINKEEAKQIIEELQKYTAS